MNEYGYEYEINPDPYCFDGSNVLKNKLGITDSTKLEAAEREYTMRRMFLLSQKPISGRFGFAHLKNIHKFIFDGIFDWAGIPRKQGFISKSGTIFCRGEYIEQEASRIFSELADERKLRELPFEQFVSRLAYYASEINALHPFRDGNGRTAREFIRQLAAYNGYAMIWHRASKEILLEADVQAFTRNYKPLIDVYSHILEKRM